MFRLEKDREFQKNLFTHLLKFIFGGWKKSEKKAYEKNRT